MNEVAPSKYHLRDLFKEIDFLDRKISYCQNLEKFEAESARMAALGKLNKTRGQLVKKAEDISLAGVTCDPKDLPRSYKNEAAKSSEALKA